MADSTSRIGGASSGVAAGYSGVTQTAEGAASRNTAASRPGSGNPGAGRGRVERFTASSAQAPDQLDRNAPKGSYINILA
jgi:hypothetical protein